MDRHIVFVHGVRRAGQSVWMSSGHPTELWPPWLASDVTKSGIWSVEYDSAPTMWRGQSMARADRANNVLALLLAEERLKQGDIAFVAHSFGGLVVEHLLRLANERRSSELHVADFLRRISRITFLGTPHRGADLATMAGRLRLLARPSLAAMGLTRNDADLRDLNQFYRGFAIQNGIDTQCLVETRPTRWLGMVVKPDSADIGVPSAPIPVDADHFEIASPASKNSEIYIHVREQMKKQAHARPLLIVNPATLEGVAKDTGENRAALERIEQKLSATPNLAAQSSVPSFLVDAETNKRVLRLRRMRFFAGATHLADASQLAQDLLTGHLAVTSATAKASALAWCARVLLSKPDRSEALHILAEARRFASTEEVLIAEAFAVSYEGDSTRALHMLSEQDSDEARAAAFIVVANDKTRTDALEWLGKAGLAASNVASDGKFFIIKKQFDSAKWNDTIASAKDLQVQDFDMTPVLLYMAASAHLLQAVPDELRSFVLWHLPFDAALVPLADDAASVAERRSAKDLYAQTATTAASLGCLRASYEASDRALWLGLRDPPSRVEALAELERSMRNPTHSLRRLPLALQFGLRLDLLAVEREIDRQDALSDGSAPDVALARLSMALTKSNPRDAADYIAKHRGQLLKHVNPAFIASVEIQVLAQSGQIELAERRILELPAEDSSEHERNRLIRIVAEAKGENPIEAREEQFKKSGALGDLANLIELLEEQRDWPRLVTYGRQFFDRTHDVGGCRAVARALFETGDFDGVLQLLNRHPDLVDQSAFLQAITAWSFYSTGNIHGARGAIAKLRTTRDDANDRVLLAKIGVASGDWNSLGAFVEQEWERRVDRTAEELLRAGQLAHYLGSARAKDLILEAASGAGDDPAILIGCYSTAVSAGWEDEQTSSWLERAAQLSGDDGPVRRLSLREIVDLHPEWQQRENRAWEQLHSGEIPTFAAGYLLNRSLSELFLIPAIANVEAADPRKRAQIYAYSGARHFFQASARTAAIDPTALLTLGLLGAIDGVFAYFDKIIIPHSTLGWLFEEKQRIQFVQPSKIVEAKEIKRLLDTGFLQKFEPSVVANNDLAAEIGADLAALFSEVAADFGDDRRQRLVVRSSPVHRIESLMEEEADLGEHAKHVCGCLDVVLALVRQGQLTQAEEQRSFAYLKLREKPWPTQVTIEPGAVLYLDELSVSYLQHLRLLSKIHVAGFTGIIPPGEVVQGNNFARYEELLVRATAIIEKIRRTLSDGIAIGKVVLAPSSQDESERSDGLRRHPTFEIVATIALADVLIVDDRHFNQHGHVSGEFGAKPIWTTYDALTFSSTNPGQLQEYITGMRRNGLCFVPVKVDELMALVMQAAVVNGRLIESAELKALRESLQLARMSNGLQWPKERVWLDNVTIAFFQTIKAQWRDDTDENTSRAKSDWLVKEFDIRQWAHRFPTDAQPGFVNERHRTQVLAMAVMTMDVSSETKKKYWRWFDEAILSPIREQQQDLYNDIIARVRTIVSETSDGSRGE